MPSMGIHPPKTTLEEFRTSQLGTWNLWWVVPPLLGFFFFPSLEVEASLKIIRLCSADEKIFWSTEDFPETQRTLKKKTELPS